MSDEVVTGKRVLLALGLWLLAAVVIGTATVFAARSIGAAAITAIVVGEVYTLLISLVSDNPRALSCFHVPEPGPTVSGPAPPSANLPS